MNNSIRFTNFKKEGDNLICTSSDGKIQGEFEWVKNPNIYNFRYENIVTDVALGPYTEYEPEKLYVEITSDIKVSHSTTTILPAGGRRKDLDKLTLKELRQRASKKAIVGRSTMNKTQLIAALRNKK